MENSQLICSYFTTFKKKIINNICMLNSCFDSSFYLCISLNLKGMSHEKKNMVPGYLKVHYERLGVKVVISGYKCAYMYDLLQIFGTKQCADPD